MIAYWKLLNAFFFTAVGFGLLRLRHHNVVDFLNYHFVIPYHLNPENQFIDWVLAQAGTVNPHILLLAGWAAFFYAGLFAAEGIGLYLRKHWAEYLVVIVTGSLLPIEIYELFLRLAMWKFVAVAGNLLIVGYLIHRLLLEGGSKGRPPGAADKDDEGPTLPPASSRSRSMATKAP